MSPPALCESCARRKARKSPAGRFTPLLFVWRDGLLLLPWLKLPARRPYTPRRQRAETDRVRKWIRPVKGHLYQLRVHLEGDPKWLSYNFGLYPSEGEAVRVRGKVWKAMGEGLGLWAILRKLQASGDVPARILPTWVYRESGSFGARVRKGACRIDLWPFATADAAHLAMRRRLAEEFAVAHA